MTKHRNSYFRLSRAAIVPLGLLLQAWAVAAEAPITPGSVQDILGGERPRQLSTPPQVLLPLPPPPSVHDPRARRFRVNAFAMSGNTVFRERQLKRLLERFVDLELNLNDLNKAADVISEFYHARGYTLARAVVPAQRVADGVVHIQIVEGRIGKLRFSGNRRISEAFLAARTQQLQPGMLVTTQSLERDLLLLNDIPGLSAKVVLEPGAEFGTTDAEVKLSERLFSGNVTMNNHGRRETGANKLEATLNLNSPFGWGDQLSLSGSATQQSLVRYWKAGYSLPLNSLGTRVTVSSSRAAYNVSGVLAALGIAGEIRTDEIGVSHPFVRSRESNHTVNIGVRRNHLVQTALGVPLSDNRLSVLNLQYQINHIHEDSAYTNASFSVTSNFRQVRTATQQDAVPARFEGDVSHTSPFMERWDIYMRGNMVFSKSMLPDTEKFSLGGPGSVRAYRPSEVRGDSGYVATVELRRPFDVAGRMGMFRVTADAGEVNYKRRGYSDSRDRLRSAGVGAVFYPLQGLTASIDIAKAIGGGYAAADGKNHRVWMNVSTSF